MADRILLLHAVALVIGCLTVATPKANAAEVIAFWGFTDDYDFDTNPNKQDFLAEAGVRAGSANLQAYLGREDQLDNNGGGGWTSFTSPTSGLTYAPTRTLKFDDLKGGGDDFDIDNLASFDVDKLDGNGPAPDDFGNDALLYVTFDGSGYQDFELRFDIEGTPDVSPDETNLPMTFDLFYRTGGSGTWFRESSQNNIDLNFQNYDPIDPENQFASSGQISLASALNGQGQVELILSDFADVGNNEMEIDNFEIIGSASVPEPASTATLLAIAGVVGMRRKRTGFRS